jgi:hypothetical protein
VEFVNLRKAYVKGEGRTLINEKFPDFDAKLNFGIWGS